MRRTTCLATLVLLFSAAHCGTGADINQSSFTGAGGDGGAGGAGGGGAAGTVSHAGQGGSGGKPAGCDPTVDTDGDGIADFLEGDADPDMDGVGNREDQDSDGDGWTDKEEAGAGRMNACSTLADSDNDGIPDYLDLDSDNDGVPDKDEKAYDPDGSKGCRIKPNCDGDMDKDGQPIIDLIELAAGSDPTDPNSVPIDATLFFVLPYHAGEKTKDFSFSTGVKVADIYFLIDTTSSMGPTIDNIKGSLDTTIIPKILNGDPTASPVIPPIPGAWVGLGDYRDVPWAPYGAPGADTGNPDDPTKDWVYRNSFSVGGQTVYGNVAPPGGSAPNFTAPTTVSTILGSLVAGGGGDAPEGGLQALWMAATGMPYQVTLGGFWQEKPNNCTGGLLGAPCFRPGTLPIFVVVTDAAFHNGPPPADGSPAVNDYDTSFTGGTVSYTQTVDALNKIGAKVVGVTVNTGTAGAARTDLTDLALKTGSTYFDPSFGGMEKPLVTSKDTATGDVSTELVRLIGLLAGQGLHNVTTVEQNYSCAGGVDCNGDGKPDPAFENPKVNGDSTPFDASTLISAVTPVAIPDPAPYASIDATTFYGVRGDAEVTFTVHAHNDVINPSVLTVLRAKINVQTPGGQALGGAEGVKAVYFVIPANQGIKLTMRAHLGLTSILSLSVALLGVACGSTAPSDPGIFSGNEGGDGGTGGLGGTGGTGGKAGTGGLGGLGGQAGAGGEAPLMGGAGGQAGQGGAAGGGMAGMAGAGFCAPDEDMDQLSDMIEGKPGVDTDGDGTPDYLDTDSDNDTIPDLIEGQTKSNGCMLPQDSDGDKIPDFRDNDSDNNGLPDKLEIYPDGKPYDPAKPVADTDGDKYPDYADPDNDNDTLDDKDELVLGMAVDTDKDGLPDLDDPDSDNDGIFDGHEGIGDFDKDGTPNFRDLDSDNDGIPDKCEAGPGHKLMDLPIDSDQDGKYDFLDLDSDNDGLPDSAEDKNGNCIVDDGETDPRQADTDGDGVSDLIEILLGSDPNQMVDTPETHGKVYFVLPYQGPAAPESALIAVNLGLQRADLGFIVDTTGTMGGEITALKMGLTSIIEKSKDSIPDVAIGIAAHDDYPVLPSGEPSSKDLPYYIPEGGKVTTDTAQSLAAVQTLEVHNGGDLPESQVLAMWRSLSNEPYQWPGTIVDPDPTIPPDRFGALAFRKNAFTILIPITDAPFHNGRRISDKTTLHDPYGFNKSSPYPQPTIDTLVTLLNQKGAKVIGVSSDDGKRNGDPYEDMSFLADMSGSLATPASFGGTCKTGLAGTSLMNPDGPGGQCRLVFDINKTGVGMTDRIIDGVTALLKSLVLDVRIVAVPDDPSEANGFIDSVDTFIDSIDLSVSGGDDPSLPGASCVIITLDKALDSWTGPKGEVPGGDTHYDTVLGAVPTTRICYKINPTDNVNVPATDKAQVFHAVLQVRAKSGANGTEIDFGQPRDIVFVVPPLSQ